MLFGIWLILIKGEFLIMTAVADPDLQIRGPPSSRPRHKGWGGGEAVSKKTFSALLASVWSKNKGGAPPGPLPLDPTLDWNAPDDQL